MDSSVFVQDWSELGPAQWSVSTAPTAADPTLSPVLCLLPSECPALLRSHPGHLFPSQPDLQTRSVRSRRGSHFSAHHPASSSGGGAGGRGAGGSRVLPAVVEVQLLCTAAVLVVSLPLRALARGRLTPASRNGQKGSMATLEEAGGAQRTHHRPSGAGQPPRGRKLKEDTERSRKKKKTGWAGDQGGTGGALGEVCLAGEVCVPARFHLHLGINFDFEQVGLGTP